MPKIPYLERRGHMFWWRRRKPVFILPQPSRGNDKSGVVAAGGKSDGSGHFAITLRTACPREAGRRAARLNLLFEETRRRIETAMSSDDRPNDPRYLDRAMADMAATLRAQAEMMARQMAMPAPPVGAAVPPTSSPGPVRNGAPAPAPALERAAPGKSALDDPEFERAVLEMAGQEGWWHDDPDEIVAQFDMMLTGLFTLQEEYLRYCVRKGLDPASALPSLAPLDDALSAATQVLRGGDTGDESAARSKKADHERVPRAAKRKGGRKFSVHAQRFLDLRSEGFDLKRRHEVPDTKAGQRFTKTSRANFEGTVRLFLQAHGDVFVEDIDEATLNDFFSLLDRIPASHGKSSKDRRSVREVIEETDRAERSEIARRQSEMRRDGLSSGEIEEALDALRVRRLRTNTCKRHMDTMDKILAFAQFEGLRDDNPVKHVKWTQKEISRRLANEEDADRLPWGDRLPTLLGSPIYTSELSEPGDPLFWAPLLGLFAGFRMEEALQLGTEDFDTIEGVPVIRVLITGAQQSRKSRAAKRGIPIHDGLLELGLLKLVQFRRDCGHGRLFTFLERGQAKGKFSEIFSKRFTHYRKRCGIYDRARDFHSLRKDFQTKLTRAEVPYHSRKLLMGHELSDVTHKHYYPEGDTIEMMRDYINRIDVDCSRILRPFDQVDETNVHTLSAQAFRA
ncbi:Site-specific recombinase XerD [Poseidonocella pacifica]|uniref:Site-specific recombinase XerD n=1 Tax=Poseidonocella pacifica TaxID=871651 RepID=A0A1I0YQQ5_9RHOB|nr:tyrosine-type recombinase/integrase [Poseidonocella pacifica]SFB14790.1 Site-specific recombinase XerD [Poseidonocella pacifica]